ncbi:hypothetical protein [Brachybacterium sacelli]|uniref:5-methylthioribose kinase n=1 Tax=Brachybacterium sacelli TaxID=173364 RepID=A0ABS4WY78_9MICO|nr:hypothetical protein [Brachybacterium sacelli]MBP2381156.1 5-methylthioribose kinase [Brachybacterium sacelli]
MTAPTHPISRRDLHQGRDLPGTASPQGHLAPAVLLSAHDLVVRARERAAGRAV